MGWPLREVGALLETKAFHPGRSERAYLAALAASNAIPFRRVGEVGYLLKDRVADVDEFTDAVTRIAASGTALDPEVVRNLLAA